MAKHMNMGWKQMLRNVGGLSKRAGSVYPEPVWYEAAVSVAPQKERNARVARPPQIVLPEDKHINVFNRLFPKEKEEILDGHGFLTHVPPPRIFAHRVLSLMDYGYTEDEAYDVAYEEHATRSWSRGLEERIRNGESVESIIEAYEAETAAERSTADDDEFETIDEDAVDDFEFSEGLPQTSLEDSAMSAVAESEDLDAAQDGLRGNETEGQTGAGVVREADTQVDDLLGGDSEGELLNAHQQLGASREALETAESRPRHETKDSGTNQAHPALG